MLIKLLTLRKSFTAVKFRKNVLKVDHHNQRCLILLFVILLAGELWNSWPFLSAEIVPETLWQVVQLS